MNQMRKMKRLQTLADEKTSSLVRIQSTGAEENTAKLELKKKVVEVLDILETKWGQEKASPDLSHPDPLDGLIHTVLSQNTNDKNRDRAFAKLKEEFSDWEMVLRASEKVLAETIRVAGLANTKSIRIKKILERVKERFKDTSLKEMTTFSRDEIVSFLEGLPGVGPKTIACVLVFEFKIPSFPVDTHVYRFCKRMEWVNDKTSPASTQSLMEDLVPDDRKLGAHLNVITHGRNICYARNPRCGRCKLEPDCPFAIKNKSISFNGLT